MDNCTSHKELLLGLNLGHEYAFEQVFKLHFGEICYFVEKLTGSPFVAEDIVATIFLKLWEKKPEFESLQKLKAYLFIVSRNASLDYLRAKRLHDHLHKNIRYTNSTFENGIERKIVRSEAFYLIYAEIKNLPRQVREIIRLSFVDGLSVPEIVNKLGLAYQTVQNQKSKGIKLLRKAIIKDNLISPLCL
ncbi:MAG: sigma-70 family RNA polymerase sigma factor [Sphingobacteriales bacterium]|nr:sigma-70 family RNA polymerase sigma factor [Sphingobacteriales bacterium]OJV98434.1 MAG: hypothetical protein BGO52_11640 [Sphingobacteriales bacterium 44-61]